MANGAWHASSSRDELTDKIRVIVRTDAIAAVRLGRTLEKPSLIVRCYDGELDVYISTEQVLDDRGVEIRFDERPPESMDVIRSDDYRALFAAAPTTIAETRFREASRLRARITPYSEVATVATFRLVGFTNHLPRLKSAGCDLYEYDLIWPDTSSRRKP